VANRLQADEISSIIKERIENFNIGVDIDEVGRVIGVADGITSVYGLDNGYGWEEGWLEVWKEMGGLKG